jgi:hypothetical protein
MVIKLMVINLMVVNLMVIILIFINLVRNFISLGVYPNFPQKR